MKMRELAQAYGMTVSDLCKRTGYTPQGLNRILRSDRVVYPGRFWAALLHLLILSNNIEQDEIEKAQERSRARFDVLDRLAAVKGIQWRPSQEPFDDSPAGIAGRADTDLVSRRTGGRKYNEKIHTERF